MQSFLGGGDKGGPSSPLHQLNKREGADTSLFRDRPAGPSQHAGPSRAAQARPPPPAQTFDLSRLSSALGPVHAPIGALTAFSTDFARFHAAHQTWAQHAHPAPGAMAALPPVSAPSLASEWAASFSASGKGKAREAVHGDAPAYAAASAPGFGSAYARLPMYQPTLQPYASAPAQPAPLELDARAHADMEAAFERALADARAHAAAEAAQQQQSPPTTEGDGEDVREFKGDLEAVWESLKPEAERLNQLAEWEAQFSQFVNGEDDTFDILNEALNRDDVGQASLDEQLQDFDGARLGAIDTPPQFVYQFASPNRFSNHSPGAAWSEAIRVLSGGGSLADAALLLQSFIQNATPEDYAICNITEAHAWNRLARAHAEDENETQAIAAFQRGQQALAANLHVDISGELLTNTAISYVNEYHDMAALQTLHQFLELSHAAQAGPVPTSAEATGDNPWAAHQRVREAFLGIAREQYTANGRVDPDVQVALGTLYYMMGDYGEARGCWTAALNERPEDYLLWNRLGATLANSGSSEDAVDAYRRALEIKPTYTRAVYNLGVACLNIGVYREAAEHFLAALALQANEANAPEKRWDAADNTVWSVLRRALDSLDMPELAAQARAGTDLGVFRQAGFDFQ
ncbi:Peroxisomal membrane signal receptor PTS1 [Cryptotrichosporon argae]